MAQPLIDDELWSLIKPLLPVVERCYRYPGRKRLDDRKVLTGIVFVQVCTAVQGAKRRRCGAAARICLATAQCPKAWTPAPPGLVH